MHRLLEEAAGEIPKQHVEGHVAAAQLPELLAVHRVAADGEGLDPGGEAAAPAGEPVAADPGVCLQLEKRRRLLGLGPQQLQRVDGVPVLPL